MSGMRILIYPEPHPVPFEREILKGFGKRFLRMLEEVECIYTSSEKENVECRIFIPDYLRSAISVNYKACRSLIFPSQIEACQIKEYEVDLARPEKAVSGWRDLMLGRGESIYFYEKMLHRMKTTLFDFDVIVCWGANSAIQRLSKIHGIYCVSLSEGCTNRRIYDSFYLGSNIPQIDSIFNAVKLDKIETSSLETLQFLAPISMVHGKHMDAAFRPLCTRHAGKIYRNIGRNVLVPLQLRDNPNVILDSEYHTTLTFLQKVIPLLSRSRCAVFILPHAEAKKRRLNRADHVAAKRYCRPFKNIVWLNDVDQRKDYLSLLKKMDLIVAPNIWGACDAMLMGKPVTFLDKQLNSMDAVLTAEKLAVQEWGTQRDYQPGTNTRNVVSLLLQHFLIPKEFLFKPSYFFSYVQHVCQYQAIYKSEGACGLTNFLNNVPPVGLGNVNDKIYLQLTESPESLVKFNAALKFQGWQEKFERMQRKLRKLWLDPNKFLIDSRYRFMRMLGRVVRARSE